MSLNKKKIFIFLQRNWGRKIGHPIAKRFSDEGASMGALTLQKDYHQSYLDDSFKYDWIASHDDIMNNPKKFLGDDSFSIEEICLDLEIDSIWPFVQSMREHVRNYKNKFFFGSFKQNVTDENIVLYVKAIYKLLLKIKKEFSPELFILPNFVSLLHIFTYLFCKKNGIKIFAYTTASIKDASIFINDIYESTGRFFEDLNQYTKDNKLPIKEKLIDEYLEKEFLKFKDDDKKIDFKLDLFINSLRLGKKIYKSLIKKDQSHHKEKGNLIGVYQDNLKTRYLIRDFFSYNLNFIKTKKIKYYDLEKINNFVYMPLQFQPEANIDVISVTFNNQIETARQIAMNLPGDLTLVVKDHPEMMGLRSYEYLEKVLKTPNVKLIDSSYKGTYVIRKAKLLIAPVGTSFFEAALMKKPGLMFGNLGTAKILPNTLSIENYKEIPKKIKEIMKMSKDWNDDYMRQLKIIIGCSLNCSMEEGNNYTKFWTTKDNSKETFNFIYNQFKSEVNRLI